MSAETETIVSDEISGSVVIVEFRVLRPKNASPSIVILSPWIMNKRVASTTSLAVSIVGCWFYIFVRSWRVSFFLL